MVKYMCELILPLIFTLYLQKRKIDVGTSFFFEITMHPHSVWL